MLKTIILYTYNVDNILIASQGNSVYVIFTTIMRFIIFSTSLATEVIVVETYDNGSPGAQCEPTSGETGP